MAPRSLQLIDSPEFPQVLEGALAQWVRRISERTEVFSSPSQAKSTKENHHDHAV